LLKGVGRVYVEGLRKLPEHPDAAIEVETIDAPVLLVCGERDTLWPSCHMARQLRARAERAGGRDVRILAYERAGHRVFGPAVSAGTPDFDRLGRWGGTPAENNAARVDAWPKIIRFLQAQLGS
jgi:dienelactone hydrolase